MRLLLVLLLAAPILPAHALIAQWVISNPPTTADLRGVVNTGGGAVWASGTNGTVVHSEDGGYLWQTCTVPPGAEKLDFRGIQAWDEKTAIVMSSGKGDLSRLYKTTDGCKSWHLVFNNPDAEGFFDTLKRVTGKQLYLLGDPVGGKFSMFFSSDAGDTWFIADDPGLEADKDAGAFAASNSSFTASGGSLFFGTGGSTSAHVYYSYGKCEAPAPAGTTPPATQTAACPLTWAKSDVPLATASASAGVFSLAVRTTTNMAGKSTVTTVAVGGAYDKPQSAERTSATSKDGGKTWLTASTMPSGYRSAVAFDSATQTWITVGPNGTDISTDDGQNWRPLKPTKIDTPDADKNWNALSLPFAVGPKGRIGRLNTNALISTKP